MSVPLLWATLRCPQNTAWIPEDGRALGPAAEVWRQTATTVIKSIPEEYSHLPDVLQWIESAVVSGSECAAAQCLEFGVACLMVFQQANCTGPCPAVPENPFHPGHDPLEPHQVCSQRWTANTNGMMCLKNTFRVHTQIALELSETIS
jgi:hypothetical protein